MLNVLRAMAVAGCIGWISSQPSTPARADIVSLQREAGTYLVPVRVNNEITLKFVLDTGASDVSIPADVVSTLIRTGTISDRDFIGVTTYVLADGSKLPSARFMVRELRVGEHSVRNVTASVAPVQGHLLLGQSFLSKLPPWTINYQRHSLIIGNEMPSTADQKPPAPRPLPPQQTAASRPTQQQAAASLPPPQQTAPSRREASTSPTLGDPKEAYERAFDLLKRAEYSEAERALRQFVAVYPDDSRAGNAQYWLAETYYVRNNYSEAAAEFLKGYQTYPQSPKGADNLFKLGVTLTILGKVQDACAMFLRFDHEYATAPGVLKRRVTDERHRLRCG